MVDAFTREVGKSDFTWMTSLTCRAAVDIVTPKSDQTAGERTSMSRISAFGTVVSVLIGLLAVGGTPALAAPPANSRVTAATASGAAPVAAFRTCTAGSLPGARCGSVSLPLDRAHPSGTTIAIAFQLFPATDTSSPAVSTIVASNGGPGGPNIAAAGLWLFLLQPVLAHHNFLAIDHRGIGESQAIDCPALQHVLGNQLAAARACGAQLGAAAYRYGSGDVADDIDAVRRALHIDKIDYYGVSYGAVDVRAYAYRYPDHLRSAILDSPYNSKDAAFTRTLPTAMARISVLVCRRSPSCNAGNPDAPEIFDRLVESLRKHPFSGVGYNADGRPLTLRADESALLGVLYNNYFAAPAFVNQGEIFAAAKALQRGDRTPLLRLIAESPAPGDFGDPAAGGPSVGADYAVFCADSVFPWDKSAPEATRAAQYRKALAQLPANASAPFSVTTWAGFVASQPVLLIPGANACVPWPKPTRPLPPFPADAKFPSNVPALLLGGGLDYLDVKSERTLIPLFPGAKFVTVQNAGHVTTFWNPCATSIAVSFLATLQTGDTRCAADTRGPMNLPGSTAGILQLQGVSRFPASASRAIPARPVAARHGHNSSLDRKVAAVAWSTVVDAVYRLPRMTGTTGRGLRGGIITVKVTGGSAAIDYRSAKFTGDVAVTGHATLSPSNVLAATVTVAGPHGRSGRLIISATLWDPAHPVATITGTLRGHRIAVTTQTR